MDELAVKVPQVGEAANFSLRRRNMPIFNNIDFPGRN
jgi:hypothetical protein